MILKKNHIASVSNNASEWSLLEMQALILELPFPPSVNHYLSRKGHRSFLTAKAKQFHELIALKVYQSKTKIGLNTPLDVTYQYWFPDRRKRDIANYEKVLTDSMVRAGVMVDDHIIHRLTQVKMGIRDDGLVHVIIRPFHP
jgi:crossover junction endodeoxyribonuclease RusA